MGVLRSPGRGVGPETRDAIVGTPNTVHLGTRCTLEHFAMNIGAFVDLDCPNSIVRIQGY